MASHILFLCEKKKITNFSPPTCKEKKKEENPLSLAAVYHVENREGDQKVFETFFAKVLIFASFFTRKMLLFIIFQFAL